MGQILLLIIGLFSFLAGWTGSRRTYLAFCLSRREVSDVQKTSKLFLGIPEKCLTISWKQEQKPPNYGGSDTLVPIFQKIQIPIGNFFFPSPTLQLYYQNWRKVCKPDLAIIVRTHLYYYYLNIETKYIKIDSSC